MRHISITPVLGVGITDLRPVLDDEVYIQRDYPDGEPDQVRMTIAEAFQVRDALAHLLVDSEQATLMASETNDAARIVADEANSERAKARRVMDAGEQTTYRIGVTDYPRIRYGSETRAGGGWHISSRTGQTHPCGDCAVPVGAYHVPGCDVEECPRCHGQSISCDCESETMPELQEAYERLLAENARLQAALESQTRGMGYLNEACRRRDKMIAALREIAQTVASLWGLDDCSRGNEFPQRRVSLYSHDGAVDVAELREQARALLADTPTTRLDATQRNND